jgi:hypothetical protein
MEDHIGRRGESLRAARTTRVTDVRSYGSHARLGHGASNSSQPRGMKWKHLVISEDKRKTKRNVEEEKRYLARLNVKYTKVHQGERIQWEIVERILTLTCDVIALLSLDIILQRQQINRDIADCQI